MRRIWLDSYAPGVPAEIQLRHRSLADMVEDACRTYAARPAFAALGDTIDFGTFGRLARDFAAFLQQRLGLVPGQRIGLMMPNQFAYAVAIAGALRAGLTIVNLNPMLTPRELREILADATPQALVALDALAPTVRPVQEELGVPHLLLARLTDLARQEVAGAAPSDFMAALEAGRGLTLRPPALDRDAVAFLQYTGGTTGKPKGAMLTHGNVLANVEQNRAWSSPLLTPGGEIVICALPLYHIYGLTINYFVGLTIGAMNVLIPDARDLDRLLAELRRHPFTILAGVNTLFDGLLRTPGFEAVDFSRLKATYGGGMRVHPGVAERWAATTGCEILEGYGLTECSPTVSGNRHDLCRFNETVGLPYPSTHVSIRDEEDEAVGIDTPGELCVSGPQVMQGYWRREAASRNARTADGYLRTGDIATMDGAGFLRILARTRDLILVSGFNVYPSEVEQIARQLAEVAEAACIGAPDGRGGELVKLCVVPAAGAAPCEARLREHCRRQLTPYKVPRVIEFREALPKSAVGKVLRQKLREEALGDTPADPPSDA